MTRYAFATTEYWPLTDGGAGRLNADLVDMLVAAGHDVHVVLVSPLDVLTTLANVHVVHPTDSAGWAIDFMATSKAAAEGLAEVNRETPLDRVEIQDFDGLPFWTLTHRRDLGLATIPITIRFHGPVDLQIEAMGVETAELAVAAQMERESFSMADATVVPSEGIRTLVADRYGLEPGRVLVGSPIVRRLPVTSLERPQHPRFTVVGRLSEVKGSHDMVAASIPFLRGFPDATVTFVGSDGWSATADISMQERLVSAIPSDVADQIVFHGPANEEELARIVAQSTAVVAPSRFESFNLAVHEARAVGVAVVVPSIPAFSALLGESVGVLGYDGSVDGLTQILTSLSVNPGMARRLAEEPPPRLGEPLAPYVVALPEVWHVRSQGGLATAALARTEAIRYPRQELSRGRELLQSVLRIMPTSVVGFVSRALPSAVRRRIWNPTQWDLEEERQRKSVRWAAVRLRISNGHLDDIAAPKVSIVIPCFNQGEFVEDAVLSVFEQTVDSFDIVIVDDGSDDGQTPDFLDTLSLPRVTVIHQENVGLPGARNRGIEAARGEYVVTLDADDELAPTYVETLGRALDGDDSLAFAHCWAELFGDFQAVWATRPMNRYQLLLSNSVVGCVMLRKSAWKAVDGYNETMLAGNEDWDLWIRLSEVGFSSIQIREPLFRYRKHGVSMSVETEAKYESALTSLARRLPDIYSHEYLSAIKRQEYPLLTVLTDDDSFVKPFDDSQVICTSGSELAAWIREVRGKYAVWWPEGTIADGTALVDLCEVLEDDDNLGAAETVSAMPLRVVRSWSLRDPSAPSGVVTVDTEGSCSQSISCGQFPDVAWQVPLTLNGTAVQRQRPEESGFLPTWVST